MGAIYRNGYKYGDGNGVAQNPVLAIKSGNELYKPENGVVELPDFNEAIKDNAITNTASAAVITLSDTADSNPLALTVYGKSEVVDDAIISAGDSGSIEIETCGKNLFNSKQLDVSSTDWKYSTIKLKPNTTYTMSTPNLPNSTSQDTYPELYFMLVTESADVSRKVYINHPMTKTSNANGELKIQYRSRDNVDEPITNYSLMLVEGSTATAYEPYTGTMAVFSTGVPLRGIPDTAVKDFMYWDGSSGEVTKNCDEADLSTLVWERSGTMESGTMVRAPFNHGQIDGANGISELYTLYTNWASFLSATIPAIFIGENYIFVANSSNPNGKLVYELATPTTQPLTSAEVNAFKQLRTYDPNTTVSNNTDSVMDIRYYKNSTNGNTVKDIDKAVDEVNERVPKKIEPSCTTTKLDNTTGWFIDMTFSGLTSFDGNYIWTDGENIYYSNSTNQYVFNKASATWSSKTWSGLTDFDGRYVWTDGVDIYYSKSSEQYVLNKSTSTWSTKTWTGLTSFYGGDIWTDGDNIYRSNGSNQYVLDKSTSTWSTKTWTGLTSFYSSPIWSDGENIYYSSGTSQYILNKETSTWSTKTWGGTNINGSSVWTDGNDIYYSYSTNDRYVLDRSTDTWYAKKWNGIPTNFNGLYVWTDGDNIYYSSGETHKKLIPKPKIKSTRLH